MLNYESYEVEANEVQGTHERDIVSYYTALDEMEAYLEGNVEE